MCAFTIRVMCPKDGMANSEDPDQTAPAQTDLDLHCLLRSVCQKTLEHYCKLLTCKTGAILGQIKKYVLRVT